MSTDRRLQLRHPGRHGRQGSRPGAALGSARGPARIEVRPTAKVLVDRATGATSIPGLFAGGDCLRNGGEIVDAVQDGKIAARGIIRAASA